MAKRPGWFIILVVVLIIWGLAGCAAFAMHVLYGPAMDPAATDWDRAYFAALPAWFSWDYAVAVGAGLLGSIALLARSKASGPLYVLSLIAVVIQFGYVFFSTDLLAHKGAAATIPFPAFIFAMALLQVWLAGYARDRNWAS
ncbi:MAG: hypothetical protein EON93_18650 [Burkholderiales bacterium]|nr:MAG: hypothetical protein EON93_18650 [Burkholderiales bacterium]